MTISTDHIHIINTLGKWAYRTEVENPSTCKEWHEWSRPILDILKQGPHSILELKAKIKEANIEIKGGVLNSVCWLDLHGAIIFADGKWMITNKFQDRKEEFNLHDYLQSKADKYRTTVNDILSDKKIGKCVLARDEAFYHLREMDLELLSKQTGIDKERIQNCIARYKMRKIGV